MKPRGWRTTVSYYVRGRLRILLVDLAAMAGDVWDLIVRLWRGPKVAVPDYHGAPILGGRGQVIELHVDEGNAHRMVTNYLRTIETMQRVEAYAREQWPRQ